MVYQSISKFKSNFGKNQTKTKTKFWYQNSTTIVVSQYQIVSILSYSSKLYILTWNEAVSLAIKNINGHDFSNKALTA